MQSPIHTIDPKSQNKPIGTDRRTTKNHSSAFSCASLNHTPQERAKMAFDRRQGKKQFT